MDSQIEIERVIPIDPHGKYVLILPEGVDLQEAERVRRAVEKWYASDSKFLAAPHGVEFHKVEVS